MFNIPIIIQNWIIYKELQIWLFHITILPIYLHSLLVRKVTRETKWRHTVFDRLFDLQWLAHAQTECPSAIYRWFSPDVTAPMLVHRTIEKKVFWEFDSILMQNMSLHLLLFCAPTRPSRHVIENHLYVVFNLSEWVIIIIIIIIII